MCKQEQEPGGPSRLILNFNNSTIDALDVIPPVLRDFAKRLLIQSSGIQLLDFADEETLNAARGYLEDHPGQMQSMHPSMQVLLAAARQPGSPGMAWYHGNHGMAWACNMGPWAQDACIPVLQAWAWASWANLYAMMAWICCYCSTCHCLLHAVKNACHIPHPAGTLWCCADTFSSSSIVVASCSYNSILHTFYCY